MIVTFFMVIFYRFIICLVILYIKVYINFMESVVVLIPENYKRDNTEINNEFNFYKAF